MSGFKRAERKQVKLKLGITGPSGSGKTYSGLLIAKGLGAKKIAVIDTENDSAQLYAASPGIPEFDSQTMHAPFHTSKYLAAINEAVKAGYDALIIDSISHQWSGEGGIMDRMDKEKMARPQTNSYTMWAKFTPEHEQFKQAIVQAPIHIIVTMRSKQDYILQTNDKGKQTPTKVGMAPVQRDQFEYELTTVFDLSMEHYATVSKDRTSIFDGSPFKPSVETGEKLIAWLNSGRVEEAPAPVVTPPAAQTTAPTEPPTGLTTAERDHVINLAKQKGWTTQQVIEHMAKSFGKQKVLELTKPQYQELLVAISTTQPGQTMGGIWNPEELKS